MTKTNSRLQQFQVRAQTQLANALPDVNSEPKRLHEAMHYAVLNGGKRVRPLLVYATGESLGAKPESLDAAAVAVELIHAYSLVHDDLPAMDDDDLRRGKPTCHKAFDEATAILVGDALQSLSFEVLTKSNCDDATKIKMLSLLAEASGSFGMAGGQAIDLNANADTMNIEKLCNMHQLKTGALIKASVMLGAYAAGCEDKTILSSLESFSEQLGLAFQIQDDILDIESTTEQLGKPQGSDIAHNKATYPALTDLETAKEALAKHEKNALHAINEINAKPLLELLTHLTQRTH